MTQTKTQQQVILSDWLSGRRDASQGYIHKNGSVGIGSTVRAGQAYSHYLTGNIETLDDLELLRKARKTAESLTNTLSPHPVKVVLGSGSGSFNERGTQITLESDHFDRRDLSAGQKTDILLGYAVHEAAHSLHSDFKRMESYLKGADHAELRKTLWNILEDERIEYLVGDAFPGYINYVGQAKKHLWERLLKERRKDSEPKEAVARVVNCVLGAVRFPSMLDPATVSEHFDELDATRRVLTPFPMTAPEVERAVDGIIEIIRGLVKQDLEQQQSSGLENSPSSGEGSPSGPEGTSEDTQSPEKEDGQKDGTKEGNGSCSDVDREIDRQTDSSEGRSALRQAQSCSSGASDDKYDSKQLTGTRSQYVNDDRADRCSGRRGDFFTVFPKPDKKAYLESRNAIQRLVPSTAMALTYRSEESEYCLRGMPSGKLDMNKIVSYMAGSPNIFNQHGSITCDKIAVCVLIDESGSMCGRLRRTRDAAILINEAVKRIPKIDYFAYGFTTGRLNVYCEGGLTDGFALGSTVADSGTPTGDAMKLSADRVRRYTKGGILMIVLTDGEAQDKSDVIRQDALLRRDGIIPVGVGIQTDCVKDTFKEWVRVDDLDMFPQKMARLTRDHLAAMLVRHDTLD